jgi:[citrate (pro-3S)-lyase] ligase
MDIELFSALSGAKYDMWKTFCENAGLAVDSDAEKTVLVSDDEKLIAVGSRKDNVLKYIAVDPARQGEGLTAVVLTSLRQDAFSNGFNHLFLYTKPENEVMFSDLFFYPVAKTDRVLLMENRKGGIDEFLSSLPKVKSGSINGAVVMNCNPFTKGHRHLIETCAKECDTLFVFVLSEDKSRFCAKDRFEMVKLGTKDIENVVVLPTGPYLISSATFPTYFLKNRDDATSIQCMLDIEIFAKHLAPALSITKRFVGTEPISPMTEMYNKALKENLPRHGIDFCEIERIGKDGAPISASRVRKLIDEKNTDAIKELVPDTTYDYLKSNNLI